MMLAVWRNDLQHGLSAPPCLAIVVAGIRQHLALVVELAVRETVLRDGEEKSAVLELDHTVVVEHVVRHLVRYARRRCPPRLALVKRAAHCGTAIRRAVLEAVEERDLAALEAEEAYAHHIHAAVVLDDDLVVRRPGLAIVRGVARGDVRRRVIGF